MKSRKSAAQILIAVEILALIVVLVFGVIQKGKATVQEEYGKSSQVVSSQTTFVGSETESQEETENNRQNMQTETVVFSEQVTEKLSSMTLEEKVAQMFLITPEMLTNADAVNVAGNTTKNAINEYPVGGLIYSEENFEGKEQGKKLLSKTQSYAMERIGLPMFLAVEEVGGKEHSPIAQKVNYEVAEAPSAITDAAQAKEATSHISTYLTDMGITMNLVPFAGLSNGKGNAVTFGSDASKVSILAAESISGYQQEAMKTAVGVFPGTIQTKSGTIKSFTEWKEADALVFKAAMNAGCECIVVGNVSYEALTKEADTICSMSENVVQYLREDMGFQGILMTDSLSEEVITSKYSSAEAAVCAIQAGMNLLYCPQNFEEAYKGVLEAVNNGTLKIEVIDESVGRILTEKMS